VTPVRADRLPSGAPEASRRRWERAIPQSDRLILDTVLPIHPAELGKRPALLVVDVTYGFTGTLPRPLAEAITEYPTSCGAGAWEALPRIRSLIDAFREQDLPVIFTTGEGNNAAAFGPATTRRRDTDHSGDDDRRHELHEQIVPDGPITVIAKTRASAFFGTPLSALLTRLRVDSVVLAGVRIDDDSVSHVSVPHTLLSCWLRFIDKAAARVDVARRVAGRVPTSWPRRLQHSSKDVLAIPQKAAGIYC